MDKLKLVLNSASLIIEKRKFNHEGKFFLRKLGVVVWFVLMSKSPSFIWISKNRGKCSVLCAIKAQAYLGTYVGELFSLECFLS